MNTWVTATASASGLLYAIAVSPAVSVRMVRPADRRIHRPAIVYSEQAGLEGVAQKSERPESTLPVPP